MNQANEETLKELKHQASVLKEAIIHSPHDLYSQNESLFKDYKKLRVAIERMRRRIAAEKVNGKLDL